MPLYISSSDKRMRFKTFAGTWLPAVLIVIAVLGSWELFWRYHGFSPCVEDDMNIWHLQRSKVSDTTKLVFIGASRAQLGFHPDVFAEKKGVIPVNLSIDGTPPFPVLKDLAEDQAFSGTVLCSVLPRWLAEKAPDNDRASKWVRKYHKRTILSRVDTLLTILVQKLFVFRYPGLSPEKLIDQIKKKEWPNPPFAPMRTDRFREARFTRENTPKILESRIKREQEISRDSVVVSAQELMERIQSLKADVRKIKDRGGRVIFIRMPSSGTVREIEAHTWPRSRYWDVFAANIGEPAFHFEDYNELKNFKCPDGSHLDAADAGKFTRALLQIIPLPF